MGLGPSVGYTPWTDKVGWFTTWTRSGVVCALTDSISGGVRWKTDDLKRFAYELRLHVWQATKTSGGEGGYRLGAQLRGPRRTLRRSPTIRTCCLRPGFPSGRAKGLCGEMAEECW